MLNASSSLKTAMKNSLADSGAGWEVTFVNKTSQTRLANVSVSGSVVDVSVPTGPESDPLLLNIVNSVSSSSASVTEEWITVGLTATNLPFSSGSSSPLKVSYRSLLADNSFQYGVIQWNGKEYKTTDADLDTTIRTMANAFETPGDADLISILTGGEISSYGVVSLPTDVKAAVLASLADESVGWTVRSRHAIDVGDGKTQLSITLSSLADLTTVEQQGDTTVKVPMSLTFLATLGDDGGLLSGSLIVDGSSWGTSDAGLYAAIQSKADDYLSDRSTEIVEALS